MRIAIIGGTGLLGSNLIQLFSNFEVKAFSRKFSNNVEDKYNNIIKFDNIIKELSVYFDCWRPDIIINTIAMINLQECEDNYELANNINCGIAVEIAKTSKKYNSYFIHISTDHYFNDKYKLHTEYMKINLLNNYAKTKYNAEKEIPNHINNFIIVRTNIIGFRKNEVKSFFEWLLTSLKNQEKINLYSDFFTSPISVNELGLILIKCYYKNIIGTYNIASKEVIDKYSFGLKVAKQFGFEVTNISKSTLKNNQKDLKRALTLGLDVSKIEKELSVDMPTIDETLEKLYLEYGEVQ